MVYCNFEQVAIFALKEEEKCALNDMYIEDPSRLNHGATNLHLMHNGCNDYDTSRWVLKWMSSPRNGNAMLWFVHVTIYNVVFTTNKDTRRPIKSIG